jgi:hypothetical protein
MGIPLKEWVKYMGIPLTEWVKYIYTYTYICTNSYDPYNHHHNHHRFINDIYWYTFMTYDIY